MLLLDETLIVLLAGATGREGDLFPPAVGEQFGIDELLAIVGIQRH